MAKQVVWVTNVWPKEVAPLVPVIERDQETTVSEDQWSRHGCKFILGRHRSQCQIKQRYQVINVLNRNVEVWAKPDRALATAQ